jgi:ABC-type dipeptide/oligopeptide/nickel transport system ATPase component
MRALGCCWSQQSWMKSYSLSDRIAVMYRGRIVAVVPSEEATKGYIGLLMAGIPPEQAKQRVKKHSEHADKGGILG